MENDGTTEDTPLLLGNKPDKAGVGERGRGFWYSGCRCWPRFAIVEVVVVLYSLYRSGVLPLTQQFIYAKVAHQQNFTTKERNCTTNLSDPEYVLQQYVQTQSALWMIYLNLALMVPSFFTTILVGGYSDRAGRKYAMLFPFIGAMLKSTLSALAVYFDLEIVCFIGISILEGCFGGFVMVLMACFTYLADITTRENRSTRVMILEFFLGFGIAVSQFGLGYIIEWFGFMWSFVVLNIFAVIGILFIVFIVPETITPAQDVPFICLDNFLSTFRLYIKDNPRFRRWKLQTTLAICFIYGIVELGKGDTLTYHFLDSPLCWNSVTIGQFGAFSYAMSRIGSIIITVAFYRCLGDTGLMLTGCLSAIAYSVFFTFANTTTMMFLVPLVGIGSTLPIGIIRSFNSKIVEGNELGAMFASVAWAELCSAIVGSVLFNSIYSASLRWFSGFVFLLMAGMLVIPTILTVYLIVRMKIERKRGSAGLYEEICDVVVKG